MSKRSPRLLFTDEELAAPELKKAIRKADKRMKKLEKAEAKIPKKTIKKKQRVVDPKTGTVTTRLSFEEVDKKRPPSKLTHALRDLETLGIVHREQFNEVPPHVEYSLTEKGRTLSNVLLAIADWGMEN